MIFVQNLYQRVCTRFSVAVLEPLITAVNVPELN